jgi:uncharacterized protein (DUF433 family)/predicted nuclease of predicted toxin-antitoxin system
VVACRKPLLGRGAKETTNMQRRKAITKDEGVMLGKPTVAGTRLTVELILEKLAAGEGVGQIVEAYPRLDREAVREALLFAAGEGEIVARLRSEGHDVAYVPEISAGIRNDEVLARANEEGRVLLTEDKDFGDLAFFYGNRSLGIVLLRAHGAGVEAKACLVAEVLETHEDELTKDPPHLVVLRWGRPPRSLPLRDFGTGG